MGRVTDTISGSLATFRTPGKQQIRSLKAYFTPKQEGSGTPSPDNVRPITGWTGCEVQLAGRNLLDTNKAKHGHPSKSYHASDEVADMVFANGELSGTVGEGWRDTTVFSQLEPFKPGTYTVSFDYENGIQNYSWKPVIITKDYAGWYTAYRGVPAATQDSGHISATFTAADPFYVAMNLNSFGNAATSAKNRIYNLKLELSSTPTAYEPYQGTTLPIDWSSAGTVYGGYVDLVTGEVWAEYYKITLDGENVKANRAHEQNGNYGCGFVYVEPGGLSAKYKNGEPTNIWCENAPLYIGVSAIPEPPYVYAPLAGKLYLVMYFTKAADHPELADNTARINYGNEWLKSNPVTVVYQLSTPTLVTTLTPTELRTLIGTNNIWCNSGNVSVEYDFAESREMQEARKRVTAFDAMYRLPPMYKRIEYLESSGTQNINLNKALGVAYYSFYFKVMPLALNGTATNGYNGIMGQNAAPQVGWFDGGWCVGNGGSSIPYPPVIGQIYELEYSKDYDGNYVVNGQETGLRRRGTMLCRLFYVENKSTNAIARLYKAWCKDTAGKYVYNLVPCIRKSDNKPGMYDTVSKTFFTNSGTGEFIVPN